MNILEKEIEDIIFESPKIELNKRGLTCVNENSKYLRQFRVGNYGICDILEISRNYDTLYFNVIELKKEQISDATFFQALKYCKGISSFLKQRSNNIKVVFDITLIGKSVYLDNSFIYLPDFISGVSISNKHTLRYLNVNTYSYKFDGIEFTRHEGYKLIDEGFKDLRLERKFPF